MTVRRYDAGTCSAAKKLPNGWLRADGLISRTGIQEYRRADGTTVRELRLPDEVFHADALASFAMVPVTDDHPAEGVLTAENTAKLQRGHLGENLRQDGDKVLAPLLITDGALIEKILAGKQELSCGYTCDLDETPGEWQGQRYDCIQRSIRGNHVAVVDRGRAGPDVRVKLDTGDAASIRRTHDDDEGGEPPNRESTHMKIRIDGVEYEVTDQVAQAIEKLGKAHADALSAAEAKHKGAAARLDAAEKVVSAEKARADLAEDKAKKAEAARVDAADPKKVAEAVKARVAIETKAREVLGAEAKLDELDELAVKRAVLAKLTPDVKLDGKDAAYVGAAYDIAIAGAGSAGLAALRGAGGSGAHADSDTIDIEKIRKDAKEAAEKAYLKPTVGRTAQ